jgi:hypothetical protein
MIGLNGHPGALGPDLARIWAPGLPVLMAAGLLLAVFRLRPPRRLSPVAGARLAGLLDGAAVCALLVLCILAAAGGGYSPFLYYRF